MTTITPLHIERGRQMRAVVQHDIVRGGHTFDSAVTTLAAHLEIDPESVRLAIAIANDADLAAVKRCASVIAKVNTEAREGCDRCWCGCKYWEGDRCIDCGATIRECLSDPEWVKENRS